MCKKIEKGFAQNTVINVQFVMNMHLFLFLFLLDSYFFSSNNDRHQLVMWKVFFEDGNKQRKFRIEIAKTIESEHLVLDYGSAC